MFEGDRVIGLVGLAAMALMAGALMGGMMAEAMTAENIHKENMEYLEKTGKCPYELKESKKAVKALDFSKN